MERPFGGAPLIITLETDVLENVYNHGKIIDQQSRMNDYIYSLNLCRLPKIY